MMSTRGQVALAIGAGYLLGRTRRMKAALMLAGAGVTGRYPGAPRQLLQRGARLLADSPEVARLGESIRGELINAAKAAAVTAASERIDSLNNRLRAGPGEVLDEVGEGLRQTTTRSTDETDVDAPEDEYADEEPEHEEVHQEPSDEESGEKPTHRRRPEARRRVSGDGGNGSSRSRASTTREGEDAPARAPKRRATATAGSPPVRRTRK